MSYRNMNHKHMEQPPGAPSGDGKRLLHLAREMGVLRSRDLAGRRIPRVLLTRLLRHGHLLRIGRGLYIRSDADPSEHHSIATAAKRVPHGVVCLASALRFHGLTSQSPHEVWIAIATRARKPRGGDLPLRIVRFSGKALSHGVEEHLVDRVPARITSAAKTVADCFKFRNKFGLDLAIEALKDYRRSRRPLDDLWNAARACRVGAVMRPYIETIA